MPPRGHAILSPSSAERFINCPPSALANANAERQDTVFTREGTLAHEMAEVKARYCFDKSYSSGEYNAKLDELRTHELYADEMDRHTDRYEECLEEIADEFDGEPVVKFETKLDLTEWMPEAFGTADCIMIGIDDIHVIDFKYGKGVAVSAEYNPQMMIYALGAISAYSDIIEQQNIHMTIIQPRLKHDPSTFTMTRQELLDWAENVLKPAAALAFEGNGDYKMGEWCRFCCLNGQCRAQYDEFAAVDTDRLPEKLTPDELSKALELAPLLDKWFGAVKQYALDSCLDGNTVDGWKAVEGRSNRAWKDQGEAFKKAIDNGYPEEMLYERKALSVAQLEDQMGKKAFKELLGDQVVRAPGKPTLAKATDKRDAIYRATTAEEDFK